MEFACVQFLGTTHILCFLW